MRQALFRRWCRCKFKSGHFRAGVPCRHRRIDCVTHGRIGDEMRYRNDRKDCSNPPKLCSVCFAIFPAVIDDASDREHQSSNSGKFKRVRHEQGHWQQTAKARANNRGHRTDVQPHMPVCLSAKPDSRPCKCGKDNGGQRIGDQEVLRLKKERSRTALSHIDTDQAAIQPAPIQPNLRCKAIGP